MKKYEYKYILQVKFPPMLGFDWGFENIMSFNNENHKDRWIKEYKEIFKKALDVRVVDNKNFKKLTK
jgi:hypothetical protein